MAEGGPAYIGLFVDKNATRFIRNIESNIYKGLEIKTIINNHNYLL